MWCLMSLQPSIWCWHGKMSDNPIMDIPDETISLIEKKLEEIARLDPAELPDPAAELAELLNSILEDQEGS